MQIVIYTLVLLAALGLFGYNLSRRIKVLYAAGAYDPRGDVGRRLQGVLSHVFGQQRLLHGDFSAGLMHAAIFWGFVFLLLNTLHFLINGFTADAGITLPLFGRDDLLGRAYLYLRDLFDVVVLAAVIYAAFRRLVLKPKRLTLSAEAVLILGLIGTLMVTDLLMSGAGMMLGKLSPPYSPAEMLLGTLLSGASSSAIHILHAVCWWVHLLAFLLFLNLLPLSKHFHILTSVPKVYLRDLQPVGELAKIDFEAVEEFGVSRIEQLSWLNWLDAYSCTECGRCDSFCPAKQTGKLLSPQHIIINSREHIYGNMPYFLKQLAAGGEEKAGAKAAADEAQPELPALAGEVHLDQALWACTTCGACDAHCPLFIEHVSPIIGMRRHLVLEQESRFPKELQATFRGLETQGNPWGIGAHKRMEWAEGLDVPTLSDFPEPEWLYFVGCFASLDERSKSTARALVELLHHAGVSFAVLDAESCCGDPARRCGHEYLAQALIEQNAEQMKEMKPRKVFTACPHCFNTLKNEYRQFGVEFTEVVHHSELLLRLVREGKLTPREGAKLPLTVYHDSCYLGRYNGIYGAPRELLAGMRPARLADASFNRDKGYCCGAGGGRMFMEETEGERVNKFRYGQLSATGAQLVAVACPFCLTMLDDASQEAGADSRPVKDIAVLLKEAVLG